MSSQILITVVGIILLLIIARFIFRATIRIIMVIFVLAIAAAVGYYIVKGNRAAKPEPVTMRGVEPHRCVDGTAPGDPLEIINEAAGTVMAPDRS